MGLDTVLIATDSATTELGGIFFLIGRNLGMRLPPSPDPTFTLGRRGGGGGGGQVLKLFKQDKV